MSCLFVSVILCLFVLLSITLSYFNSQIYIIRLYLVFLVDDRDFVTYSHSSGRSVIECSDAISSRGSGRSGRSELDASTGSVLRRFIFVLRNMVACNAKMEVKGSLHYRAALEQIDTQSALYRKKCKRENVVTNNDAFIRRARVLEFSQCGFIYLQAVNAPLKLCVSCALQSDLIGEN